MQRANSLEKTVMLRKIKGRRRRGWQKMTGLDDITDAMDMNLGKLREIVKDKEGWHVAVHGFAKSSKWLCDWEKTMNNYLLNIRYLVEKTDAFFHFSALMISLGSDTYCCTTCHHFLHSLTQCQNILFNWLYLIRNVLLAGPPGFYINYSVSSPSPSPSSGSNMSIFVYCKMCCLSLILLINLTFQKMCAISLFLNF